MSTSALIRPPRRLAASAETLERRTLRDARAATERLRREVVARLAAIATADPTVIRTFTRAHLTRLHHVVAGAVRSWAARVGELVRERAGVAAQLGQAATDRRVLPTVRAQRLRLREAAGDAELIRALGLEDVAPDVVDSVLELFLPDLVTAIDTDTRLALQSLLRRGVLTGMAPFALMQEVGQLIQGAAFARTEAIIRTELARVYNAATDARMRQYADVVPGLRKQWLAKLDGRTRPAHRKANGQTVDLEDEFTVDGERLAYPGDPRGSAGNTINCRCRLITVTAE